MESAGGGRGLVPSTAGAVVPVPFPFSDLSSAKLRPAVALAEAGRDDWILCQITSNPYGDPHAIQLTDDSFQTGSLRVASYARPSKLFTANATLIVGEVGTLNEEALRAIIAALTAILAHREARSGER
ncbi:MAG: type II toxin-antitoxin system PemK/MazF family toxin [Acidobacteria bacterium]|nr:type II toxin-antitoxin system PemK/MazF family toxin [Acidobacteriota bacterium]